MRWHVAHGENLGSRCVRAPWRRVAGFTGSDGGDGRFIFVIPGDTLVDPSEECVGSTFVCVLMHVSCGCCTDGDAGIFPGFWVDDCCRTHGNAYFCVYISYLECMYVCVRIIWWMCSSHRLGMQANRQSKNSYDTIAHCSRAYLYLSMCTNVHFCDHYNDTTLICIAR